MTDANSIARAVDAAGPIDALVNNAGAGLMGALEGVSMDATRQIFELFFQRERSLAERYPEAYAGWAKQVFASAQQQSSDVKYASDVAHAVWRAVTDPSSPLRIPAGADAVTLTTGASQVR